MSLNIKDRAVFIADAHYPNHNSKLVELLVDIKEGKIEATQLFLMGDIFDLLVGSSRYLKELFEVEIKLIDSIAKEIDVIYIEGNHDFNLKPLFKNVKVVPIEEQPLIVDNIVISHGDKLSTDFKYKIYTKIVRNPLILKLIPDSYAKSKLKKLSQKNICKEIENFSIIIENIKKYYTNSLIIEGHFHQGVVAKNYIGLPSFACSREYAIFLNGKVTFVEY